MSTAPPAQMDTSSDMPELTHGYCNCLQLQQPIRKTTFMDALGSAPNPYSIVPAQSHNCKTSRKKKFSRISHGAFFGNGPRWNLHARPSPEFPMAAHSLAFGRTMRDGDWFNYRPFPAFPFIDPGQAILNRGNSWPSSNAPNAGRRIGLTRIAPPPANRFAESAAKPWSSAPRLPNQTAIRLSSPTQTLIRSSPIRVPWLWISGRNGVRHAGLIPRPILEQLSSESDGKYVIAKLNVDENQKSAGRFHIEGIPTLLIFKSGQLVDRLVGAHPKHTIVQHLQAKL